MFDGAHAFEQFHEDKTKPEESTSPAVISKDKKILKGESADNVTSLDSKRSQRIFYRRENMGQNFASYKELDGCLSEPEYQKVLEREAAGEKVSSIFLDNAQSYARTAKIENLPSAIFRLYALLRADDKKEESAKLAVMSDQALLAEVLRIKDENGALSRLKVAFRL